MKKLIFSLMAAMAFVSCDKDWNDINPRKVIISNKDMKSFAIIINFEEKQRI